MDEPYAADGRCVVDIELDELVADCGMGGEDYAQRIAYLLNKYGRF